jgi:hypothetical protein
LDKNERRHEDREQTVKQKPLGKMYLPLRAEYVDAVTGLLDVIEKSRIDAIETINNEMNKRLSNKKVWNYIYHLVNISHEATAVAIKASYAADYLHEYANTLNSVLTKVIEEVGDLPEKEELEKLKKASTQIDRIDALMPQLIEAVKNQNKQKIEKPKVKDSYVR